MNRGENVKHRNLWLIALYVIVLALAGCRPAEPAQDSPVAPMAVTPTTSPAAPPTISAEKQAEYEEVFDIVWQTVDEMYFDPTFNGVDWDAMRDEYRPQISTAPDDETFYLLLNAMCFELGVSHIAVVPPDSNDLEPVLSSPASAGIDVRFIDDAAAITAVEPGSAAEKAGMRPGYVILSVDELSIEEGEAMVGRRVPPFNDRRKRGQILVALLTQFYGEPGQEVAITYLDADDQLQAATLVMEQRAQAPFSAEGLPPMYVGFEARQLDNGIAYIRLDGFLPPILEDVLSAIEAMRDAPGMIIDIRGNPGGFFPVRKAIASQFFAESTLLWRFSTRPGLNLPGFEHDAYTDPPPEPYRGTVVVMVDVLSGSSSEEFAGAMQANGRAIIVGERTPGSDLVADIRTLPNGATFLYPIAQTQTADGTVLEDRGVIPDMAVALNRDALLAGVDSQLEAAIQYLLEEMP